MLLVPLNHSLQVAIVGDFDASREHTLLGIGLEEGTRCESCLRAGEHARCVL